MGTGCLRNKGDSLRHHPPEFVHFIPPFGPVLFCMTVTADRHQIREAESDGWITNVLRCNVDDMVDRIGWRVDATLQTDFTQSPCLLEV